MSVDAKITMTDGTTIRKRMMSLEDLVAWLMRHHGEYDGFEARTVRVEEIRQGREPNESAGCL